jgi:hypothetical protein
MKSSRRMQLPKQNHMQYNPCSSSSKKSIKILFSN